MTLFSIFFVNSSRPMCTYHKLHTISAMPCSFCNIRSAVSFMCISMSRCRSGGGDSRHDFMTCKKLSWRAVMIRSTVQKFAKTSDLASNLTLLLFELFLSKTMEQGMNKGWRDLNSVRIEQHQWTVCSRTWPSEYVRTSKHVVLCRFLLYICLSP